MPCSHAARDACFRCFLGGVVENLISLAFRVAAGKTRPCATRSEPLISRSDGALRSRNHPTGDGDHTSLWERTHFQARLRTGNKPCRISPYQSNQLILLYLSDFHRNFFPPVKNGEGLAKVLVSGGNTWPHTP